MDDNLSLPSVTLPRAAHAAGFSLRALRSIMAPPEPFALLCQPDRAPNARNRFAPVDIVRLAVARRLMHAGLSIGDAQTVLDQSVDNHLFGLATCGIDLPTSFLIQRIAGLRMYVAVIPGSGLVASCGALARTHEATLIIEAGAIGAAALQRLTQGTAK